MEVVIKKNKLVAKIPWILMIQKMSLILKIILITFLYLEL